MYIPVQIPFMVGSKKVLFAQSVITFSPYINVSANKCLNLCMVQLYVHNNIYTNSQSVHYVFHIMVCIFHYF